MQLAELLLERGANPNSQLKQWRPPFVRLARGQDNTLATGATPLLRAAHASDVAALKLLLRYGALVDLPNASGITPLMAAAGVGVSPNTSRAKKKTEATSIEAARLLIEAGADVNKVTHDPRRIRTDPKVREAMFGFIFQMAFDYAYLPPSGRTALHGAAQKGWNEMVRFLVENGADLQAADATGLTPRDMAMGTTSSRSPSLVRIRCERRSRCSTSFVGRMPAVTLRLSLPAASSPRSTSRGPPNRVTQEKNGRQWRPVLARCSAIVHAARARRVDR